MANRDPNQPPRDHAVAIIAGAVTLFGLLVLLSVGLEREKSPNTMAIIGILGAGIGASVLLQIMQLNTNKQTAQAVVNAAETGVDTNTRTVDIQHSVNGKLSAQFAEVNVKLTSIDSRLTNLEGTIDARARAAVAVVQSEREEHFDKRMRGIVAEVLASQEVSCRVPDPPSRRRRQ